MKTFTDKEVLYAADLNNNFSEVLDFTDETSTYTTLIRGCDITQQSSPGLTADISAGVVLISGKYYSISAGTATFANADGSNPRWDIVSVNTSGTFTVTAGTAAGAPVVPATPSGECLIGMVYRATSDNTINTDEVIKCYTPTNQRGWTTIYDCNEYSGNRRIPLPNGSAYNLIKIVVEKYYCDDGNSSAGMGLRFNDFSSNYLTYYWDNGTWGGTTTNDQFVITYSSDDIFATGEMILGVHNNVATLGVQMGTGYGWRVPGTNARMNSSGTSVNSFQIYWSYGSASITQCKIKVMVMN